MGILILLIWLKTKKDDDERRRRHRLLPADLIFSLEQHMAAGETLTRWNGKI